MSDPLELVYNSSNGTLNFTRDPTQYPNPFFTFPIETDADGNLFFPAGPIAAFTPMIDTHPNCVFTLSIDESGTYTNTGPFNSGTSLPLAGRIDLNLTWTYAIAAPNTSIPSDCSLLASCYSGATGMGNPICSSQDQAQVKMFFQSFLDTSILAVTDLPNVSQLQYQVSYQ